MSVPAYDTNKFENVHQVGGIQLAVLQPAFGGDTSTGGVRAALVNTGPLRFTVALDRGGDIIDCTYLQHSLAFLGANGLTTPQHAFNKENDWLLNWPGGLITTCGPQNIGMSRKANGRMQTQHGFYSSIPATLESVIQPDPHFGSTEMKLVLRVRDSAMFGPVLENRRTITTSLGSASFIIEDEVVNRGNQPATHHWLYHVNLGYPLLDAGAKYIYRGDVTVWNQGKVPTPAPSADFANDMKTATAPLDDHRGFGERGMIIDLPADAAGMCRMGMINHKLGLGFELNWPKEQMPRAANWQHYGPNGNYVAGLEPFNGSLLPMFDPDPRKDVIIQPGQAARYRLEVKALASEDEFKSLEACDGAVTPVEPVSTPLK